jgi:hydrogenase 3 maturation protease
MSDWQTYLQKQIQAAEKVAIVGVGSVLCADDAAGMLFIEMLQQQIKDCPRVLLVAGSTAPENFTGQLKAFRPDCLIFVDAAHVGEEVGQIDLIPPHKIKEISLSTHMLPLSFMFTYLQQEINCAISLIGIQPASTQMGDEMDEKVKRSVEALAQKFADFLKNK